MGVANMDIASVGVASMEVASSGSLIHWRAVGDCTSTGNHSVHPSLALLFASASACWLRLTVEDVTGPEPLDMKWRMSLHPTPEHW